MKLENKIGLVTGAGRGIGKGCALELAHNGADLVINDRPGSPDIASTAKEIRAFGRSCTVIVKDVFSPVGREALVREAFESTDRIDFLVSNPAKNVRGSFLEFDPKDFERVIQCTLTSGFHLSQLVARQMVKRGAVGKIVFISSVHAEMPFANNTAYGAAKAGLNHMTCTIATELSQHRINVNAIEPGWIDTPGEWESYGKDALRQEGTRLPWGRLGTPRDIGKAVTFFVSDEADYITGVVMPVDGGYRFKDLRSET